MLLSVYVFLLCDNNAHFKDIVLETIKISIKLIGQYNMNK